MQKTLYEKLLESGKEIPSTEEEIEQINKFSEAMQKVDENYRRKKSGPDDTVYFHQANIHKYLSQSTINKIPYGNSF